MSANAETMTGTLRADESPLFVINLCASTTPVALTQPNSPELKRYTFFVTRRREEGRERFRLHMGYFNTLDEAETLLADVREVYPAAWAGPAPGNKPAPRISAVPAAPKVAEPVKAAEPVEAVAPVVAAVPAVPAVPAVAAAPEAPPELTLVEDAPRSLPGAGETALQEMSNVREVLAALADAPASNIVPPVLRAAARQPAARPVTTPTLAPKPVKPAPKPVPKAAAKPSAPAAAAAPVLTPKQELSLLETGAPLPNLDDSAIRMMTPEDTQTLRDIKLDTENKAPPCFAVQLVWSVTPIDMASLTQLAIFDAYTLYHVEGSRQGRRWYGVRLGFFSDVNAAKQVAYFMKADFKSVVVVPVAVKERARALGEGEAIAAKPAAKSEAPPVKAASDGFELLPEEATRARSAVPPAVPTVQTPMLDPALDYAPVGKTPPMVVPQPAAKPALGKRPPQGGKKPTGKRVVARARRAEPGQAAPLEETLELLGASTLTLDEEKKTVIDDSALRRSADANKKKPGGLRFSKLLGRLSEKLGDTRR